MTGDVQMIKDQEARFRWKGFPWWLVAIIGFLGLMLLLILTNEDYNRAFNFIRGGFGGVEGLGDGGWEGFIGTGITLTIYTTLVAFAIALLIGLLAGLGRVSQNAVIRNVAITYVEFIRGVPTLVLIFTVAYVIVPALLIARLVPQSTFSIRGYHPLWPAFPDRSDKSTAKTCRLLRFRSPLLRNLG